MQRNGLKMAKRGPKRNQELDARDYTMSCLYKQGLTLQEIGDFDDNDRVVTVSYGGTGKLDDCLKCEKCGWSVEMKKPQPVKEEV